MFRASFLLLLAIAFLGATASDGVDQQNSDAVDGSDPIDSTSTTTSDGSVAFFSSLLLLPSIIFSIHL